MTCPERFTVAGPPYDDVVPFARAIVERFPDRVLWGTDWPHPNMKNEAPDDGVLTDMIPKIAPTAALQQALLVDNPMRLYWASSVILTIRAAGASKTASLRMVDVALAPCRMFGTIPVRLRGGLSVAKHAVAEY